MVADYPQERLADLLIDPREDLNIEIKNWLSLADNNDDKATFAKAALAIANHGGGFVIIGFEEATEGAHEAPGRPATLDAYQQDLLNGIIQSYADPAFHCSVALVPSPDGSLFPIVRIPGGHKVPIRAKRAGPHGRTVEDNAIYIRKPGPRSEKPASAMDWDGILSRCLANRRDEFLDLFRGLMSGDAQQATAPSDALGLDRWIDASFARWRELSGALPNGSAARFPNGYIRIAYRIEGQIRTFPPAQFPEILRDSVVSHTGWPPFWYPTRPGIAPYSYDNTVECWIGGDEPEERDPSNADFWRISPDGYAFLIRGFQEDGPDGQRPGRPVVLPGTLFDITLPVWRIGEALLHAERLASNLAEGSATVTFSARFEGLAGRQMTSLNGLRLIRDGYIARQDSINLQVAVEANSISANLPEIVYALLEPLYSMFNFMQLPKALVDQEISRMRQNQF